MDREELIEEVAEQLSDYDDQFIWQYRQEWDKDSFRSRAEIIINMIREQ